jgi:hypothetical protein
MIMKKLSISAIALLFLFSGEACKKESETEPDLSTLNDTTQPMKIKSFSSVGYKGILENYYWDGDNKSMKTTKTARNTWMYHYDTVLYKQNKPFEAAGWTEDTLLYKRKFYYSDTNIIRITWHIQDQLMDSSVYILNDGKPVIFNQFVGGQLTYTEEILWEGENHYGHHLTSYSYDDMKNPFAEWDIPYSKNNPTSYTYTDGRSYALEYGYSNQYPIWANVDFYFEDEYLGYSTFRFIYY